MKKMKLMCSCTEITYCERHNPNTATNKASRAIAEAKDAELRICGVLPSSVMYLLCISEPEED